MTVSIGGDKHEASVFKLNGHWEASREEMTAPFYTSGCAWKGKDTDSRVLMKGLLMNKHFLV